MSFRIYGAASLAVASLFATPQVFAVDSDSSGSLELTVVTASRTDTLENSLDAATSVITAKNIETSGAENLAELLSSAFGVQVTDTYGDGARPQISMRGFGEAGHSNTLVLVDGRRLNNTDIGSPDFSSVALKDVERIELISGGAGVLFGDQAVGGVINIVTKNPGELNVTAEVKTGSYQRRGIQAGVSHQADSGFFYRFNSERLRADGYRDHNKRSYDNSLGRIGMPWSSGEVYVEAQRVEEELELPGALTEAQSQQSRRQVAPGSVNDFSNTDTKVRRIVFRQETGAGMRLLLELAERDADLENRLGAFSFTQEREVKELTPRIEGRWDVPTGELKVLGGFDLESSDYELVSAFGVSRGDYLRRAYFLSVDVPLLSTVGLNVGGRRSFLEQQVNNSGALIEQREKVTAFAASLSWELNASLRMFARWDEPFRYAKVDETTSTYLPFRVLETQIGDSYELGGEWQRESYSLSLSAFQLDLENELFFNPVTFENTNYDETKRIGGTVAVSWSPWESLLFNASYSYVDAEESATGNELPLVASQLGRLATTWSASKRLSVFAEVQATGSRPLSGDADNSESELPGHAVVNANFSYDINGAVWSLRMNNVLNKEYSDLGAEGFAGVGFYPSPERNLWLSFKFNLK